MKTITYAISDIHGCYGDFIDMMDKIAFSSSDELYILGDIIDMGPDPIRLIKCIMAMPNVFPLFGDHEYAIARAFSCGNTCVRSDAMRTFLSMPSAARNCILEFISDMELYSCADINGKHFIMTHFSDTMICEDKSPGDFRISGHVPTMFYGCRGRMHYTPDGCNIDCGCVYRMLGGRLGCLRLDDMKEYYV